MSLAIEVTTLGSKLIESVLDGDQRLVELDGRVDGLASHHTQALDDARRNRSPRLIGVIDRDSSIDVAVGAR